MSLLPVDQIARTLTLLARTPLEISLAEACLELGVSESLGPLGKAIEVNNLVERCNHEFAPGLAEGDVDTPRVLRSKGPRKNAAAEAVQKIKQGEGFSVEFKSSLVFHHKNYAATKKNEPSADPSSSSFKSDDVTHSALKTIAAFLNSQGGTLLIGVTDEGEFIGIEWDYPATGGDLTNGRDKWELHLKNLISTRFRDGKSISDYISVSIVQINGLAIAHIFVTARRQLSFLREKSGGGFLCYKRSGNSTVQVDITEMEEFLDRRRAAHKEGFFSNSLHAETFSN